MPDEQFEKSSSMGARRLFLRGAGLATVGAMAASAMPFTARAANPIDPEAAPTTTDVEVLNFALNLEYLEAEFYQLATTGKGLEDKDISGTGANSSVIGGTKVPFKSAVVKAFAEEIASDELAHVRFLRSALGTDAVGKPAINFTDAFKALAKAAGLGDNFNPFTSDVNFIIGAFVFEDVGVTAYHGAAPAFSNETLRGYATGIGQVEAYHAGLLRTLLYQDGSATQKASAAIAKVRATLDGTEAKAPDDFGVSVDAAAVIAPVDSNGIVFTRSTAQVLKIVYGDTTGKAGGFFPRGMNGVIH